MMPKGSKGNCKSASHKLFKEKAKNRVDDLQLMFTDLQYARKESRSVDAALLDEQVHQMLREWKAELHEPSPASSLQGASLGSFSTDICRLLQFCDEEDDATSIMVGPKPELDAQNNPVGGNMIFHQGFSVNQMPQKDGYHLFDDCKGSPSGMQNMAVMQNMTVNNNMEASVQLDSYPFHLPEDFEQDFFTGLNDTSLNEEGVMPDNSCFLLNISPPPAAFLGPKCALWDCPRPAQGLDCSQEYCSNFHAGLAVNEGPPGMHPVVRPGGIGLKDAFLFAALRAKSQGKLVGIPECGGAATAKSPWNAPELFDTVVLEGETIREWLFFDKPRRAFESGNRKQRSLPDYSGRGWHESRKQVMNEYGGLKRSYYMDPQPLKLLEWHLYEYEINKCDACALYRLELKVVDGKKSPKVKLTKDTLADLQKQMGRLSAEFPSDNKSRPIVKGRTRMTLKDGVINSVTNQAGPTNEMPDYDVGGTHNYLVDGSSDNFLT